MKKKTIFIFFPINASVNLYCTFLLFKGAISRDKKKTILKSVHPALLTLKLKYYVNNFVGFVPQLLHLA